jgi:O-antigen/teichoic acid export membrane protein
MTRRKIFFGVGAGIASLAVEGLTNILVLRLLVQYLPIEAAGYWVLVTSAGSFLLMLQFGMGPTIARTVAGTLVSEDRSKLPHLLGAIRTAFVIIALLVTTVAVLIFLAYLLPTAGKVHLGSLAAAAWFPYALGLAANLQGQASLFVLNGLGEVGWDKALRAIFTAAGFIVVWLALQAGAGLVELGLVYLAQHLLFWFTAHRKLRSMLGPQTRVMPALSGEVQQLFLHGSRLLLLNVLTYLVSQATVFVVERRFGMTEVVGYSAMLRVGTLVGSLGVLLPQMMYPYVARTWAERDLARCRRYYLTGVAASTAIALALCIPLALLGEQIFAIWLGEQVPYSAMTFVAVLAYYLLYVHHSAHAMPVLATVGDPFVWPAVIIAASVVALVLILPGQAGIAGVPLGMVLGTVLPSAYIVSRAWRLFMRATPLNQGNRAG